MKIERRMHTDSCSMDNGDILEIRYPGRLSPEEFNDIEGLMALFVRKCRRNIVYPLTPKNVTEWPWSELPEGAHPSPVLETDAEAVP